MAKEYKLSPERLKALQDELVYLKTVREKEVADKGVPSRHIRIKAPQAGSRYCNRSRLKI